MIAILSRFRSPEARLNQTGRALTYARSLDEVLDLTVQSAAELLSADKVVVMLSEPDQQLRIRASWGIGPGLIGQFREPLDEHLLTRLEGVLGPEVQRFFLGVPLVTRGEVIGLLAVRRAGDGPAEAEAERLLSALADQVSLAIEGARERDLRNRLELRVDEMERQHTNQDEAIRFLSHDIRTALSSIDGYASLMAGGVLGEVSDRQRDTLERVRQVGAHLLSLLGNALEVARLRTEGVTFHSTRNRLADVVSDAVNVVIPVARAAHIDIAVPEGPPLIVVIDRHRLRQVLVQLLDNAVKYSPEHSTVTVSTRAVDEGNRGWAEVTVTDQGPGIAAQHLETIFRPYQRLDSSPASGRKPGGLGLGLAIAQGLVEQMGGRISVTSEFGHGSAFTVTIPLRDPSEGLVSEE
jgi:signal transduction histidine kinase